MCHQKNCVYEIARANFVPAPGRCDIDSPPMFYSHPIFSRWSLGSSSSSARSFAQSNRTHCVGLAIRNVSMLADFMWTIINLRVDTWRTPMVRESATFVSSVRLNSSRSHYRNNTNTNRTHAHKQRNQYTHVAYDQRSKLLIIRQPVASDWLLDVRTRMCVRLVRYSIRACSQQIILWVAHGTIRHDDQHTGSDTQRRRWRRWLRWCETRNRKRNKCETTIRRRL